MDERSGPPAPVRHPPCRHVGRKISARVLCLGNDLIADDRLGFHVAKQLERKALPGVEVVATDQAGFALLDYLLDATRVVVVDTIVTGRAQPGTIFHVSDEEWRPAPGGSPHYVGLFEALAAARKMGLNAASSLEILAVEAADLVSIGGGMTAAVRESIPEVVRQAEEILLSSCELS